MQIFSSVVLGIFAAGLSAAGVHGSPVMERQSGSGGSIIAPASNTVIPANDQFNFTYIIPTYCRPPATAFSVWLTEHQPTLEDVSPDGELIGAILHYGNYAQPNFRKCSRSSSRALQLNDHLIQPVQGGFLLLPSSRCLSSAMDLSRFILLWWLMIDPVV